VISADRLQRALTYLAETDEPCARAKGLMEGLKGQEKTILATEFLQTDGTVAEREARARISKAYSEWHEKYEQSVVDYEILRNKRGTESQIIEVWRSLEATKRASV